jgi:outer membrane protein OmpA-like peptidoglycan-associated protein
MKMRIVSGVFLLASVVFLFGCYGPKTSPDPTAGLDWWPTKATPQPVGDPRPAYKGQWWWPTDPAQETQPLWGNRGYVYVLKWTKTEAKVPVELKEVEKLTLQEVHFAFDKSELTPTAQEILKSAIENLKKYPNAYVTIEGHTCSIGTEQYNMALGQRRADSVKNFLISQGIPAERLKTISYGETRLKVSERTASDFALNRRVEFEVEMK